MSVFGIGLRTAIGGVATLFFGPVVGPIIYFASGPAGSAVESFIDNKLMDKVDAPAIGSVLYCDLHAVEHSGIYVGDHQIVHLDGDGTIQMVSPQTFLERLGGLNNALSIYVSCFNGKPVGSAEAACRAKKKVGTKRNYHWLMNNCHQFTAGCLTGKFNNGCNFHTFLEDEAQRCINANGWRVWDIRGDHLEAALLSDTSIELITIIAKKVFDNERSQKSTLALRSVPEIEQQLKNAIFQNAYDEDCKTALISKTEVENILKEHLLLFS